MNNFLYELASMKYQMYHELFKFKPSAYTTEDCFKRTQLIAKYEQILHIINLLPLDDQRALRKIEQGYFGDAPYVVHI